MSDMHELGHMLWCYTIPSAQANNATSAGQRCNSQMRCFAPCPTGYKLKNGCPTCDCAPENSRLLTHIRTHARTYVHTHTHIYTHTHTHTHIHTHTHCQYLSFDHWSCDRSITNEDVKEIVTACQITRSFINKQKILFYMSWCRHTNTLHMTPRFKKSNDNWLRPGGGGGST